MYLANININNCIDSDIFSIFISDHINFFQIFISNYFNEFDFLSKDSFISDNFLKEIILPKNVLINGMTLDAFFTGGSMKGIQFGLPGGSGGPGGPSGINTEYLAGQNSDESRKNFEKFKLILYSRDEAYADPNFGYVQNLTDGRIIHIYPEVFHTIKADYTSHAYDIRIYKEHGITYSYVTIWDGKPNYCRVTYPDDTYAHIYDKPTVMKHILFHRKNSYLNSNMGNPVDFSQKYVDQFEPFKLEKAKRAYSGLSFPKRTKITINDLLN
jgi:hypothetical protein